MEYLSQQREMPLLGTVASMAWLDDLWISRCRSEADAVALCWAKRIRKGMTLRQAAEEIGLPASHLSNILSGKKYFPHGFRCKFQMLCGNWAIRQYEDYQCGLRTVIETTQEREIRLLKSENERLRRTA